MGTAAVPYSLENNRKHKKSFMFSVGAFVPTLQSTVDYTIHVGLMNRRTSCN